MPADPGSGVRARIADLVGDGGAGAAELVGRLVASFLDRGPGLIEKLVTAVDAGDAADAAHWAHVLTGAAGNLGATDLQRLAAQAEQHATAGELGRIAPAALGEALTLARTELTAALDESVARLANGPAR
jgi:HPt (histidine-containing phosphotransfer) domain-containing protein